jgi:hypothetical protein
MALEDQAKAVTKLGSLGTDIPKLNADSVIENIIKKDENLGKYLVMIDSAKAEKVERGMTKEEADKAAEEAKKKAIEDIKKSLKPQVEEDIIKMKQEILKILDGKTMVEKIQILESLCKQLRRENSKLINQNIKK